MKITKHIIIAAFILLSFAQKSSATIGDTSYVFSHYQTNVVTNPNMGFNPYPAWTVFPPTSMTSRKIILHINYRCPQGMACGEWDYIDWVFLRRVGGVNAPSKNLEIARYITPYGNSFNSTWHSEFKLDITDYASFLHDSVEVEYQHTGYETAVGKGWEVTMYFEFIEGTPAMAPIKFTQMWEGSFDYGNAADPIDNHLQPDTVVVDTATRDIRLRILQSGHGSDNNGCSEFCAKTRKTYVNGALIAQKLIWRTSCASNPLYPQAGTWIYSRGNWCPGSWVFPESYDVPVVGGSSNVLNVDMQSYTTATPGGRYQFNAQLFEYGNYAHANDASIEEIYSPNPQFEFSRMNPVCDNASINVRNNGSATITNMKIKYGIDGLPQSSYTWTGNLLKNKSMDITLPGNVASYPSFRHFTVYIDSLNGGLDEYNYDDTARTIVDVPPIYDSVFVFVYKTNSLPNQNSYTLKNTAGATIYYQLSGSLLANTTYRDTFHLAPGCYRFTFTDSGNDGLSFWNNTAGSGNAKFVNMNNANVKVFNPDFGSQIFQAFSVGNNILSTPKEMKAEFLMDAFPNPTSGPLNLEVSFPIAEDAKLEVYNSMGQKMLTKSYKKLSHEFLEFDFSKFDAGVYYAKIFSNHYSETKEIVVSK